MRSAGYVALKTTEAIVFINFVAWGFESKLMPWNRKEMLLGPHAPPVEPDTFVCANCGLLAPRQEKIKVLPHHLPLTPRVP